MLWEEGQIISATHYASVQSGPPATLPRVSSVAKVRGSALAQADVSIEQLGIDDWQCGDRTLISSGDRTDKSYAGP